MPLNRASFFVLCIFTAMKSKEEILNSYYTAGAHGMPEISADDLLKAMEEYGKQGFEAGRTMTGDTFTFTNHDTYLAALTKNAEPEEADNIRFIADSILPQFLPNDPNVQTLSFELKTGGKLFTANYAKNDGGYWQFTSYDAH